MDYREFMMWEHGSRDTIDFKKVYVDMADDLIAGLLLSQIVYWHLPSKETGRTKLRVEKEGHLWIAKDRGDWYDEIRISERQYDRAIKILEKLLIVQVKKFKFNGQPKLHIRIFWEMFLPRLRRVIRENAEKNGFEPYSPMGIPQMSIPESHKGEFPNSPKVNSRIDLSGILLTENTDKDYLTENTNKDLKILVNNFVNKDMVNKNFTKEGLIKIGQNFYPSHAPGRWSKETYFKIVEKLVDELMDGQEVFLKAKNPNGYIKGCLDRIAYHHDFKNGKVDIQTDPETPYYNWLSKSDDNI